MAACGTDYEDSVAGFLEKTLEKEWKEFHKALIEFPHSFQLEDVEKLTKTTCHRLVKVLQADLDDGLSTSLETARTSNLLSYILFLLGKSSEALVQIEQTLIQCDGKHNLVSLGNKAVILWKTGGRDKAKDEVKALENLKKDSEFSYLVIRARAELAYSYTRLGGLFCSEAVLLFTEVIAEAREPEIWLWKFGLALTQRRMAHMNNVPVFEDATEEKKLMSILHTLQEVTDKCQSNNLKAKCFSEIAHLLHGRRGTESLKMFEDKAKLTSESACEEALKLDPNDCSVLWKCGRIFRYAKRFEESVDLLQKAVTLRPTTAEYHHLGLTFRALAIQVKRSERGEWIAERKASPRNGSGEFGGGSGNRRGQHGKDDSEKQSATLLTEEEGREEGDAESCDYVRDQNSRRWNTNSERQETDLQGTEHFQHSGANEIRERKVAENATRHGQYKHSETAYRNAEISVSSGHSQDDQMMEASEAGTGVQAEQLFDFSRLSLNTDNIPVKTKPLPNSTHYLETDTCKPVSTDNPTVVLPQQTHENVSKAVSLHDIQSFREAVKSPPKEAVQFSRTDKFVQEAMDAFERAVEMSEGENMPAVYDLALLHKALGEFDEALKLLDTIQVTNRRMGPFDKINAYEQAGLILKDKSVMETDVEKQKKLNEEGESKLNMALCLCSRLCSRLPGLQHVIHQVWNAFPTLFQAAEESDRHIKDKLIEKARLFKLIKDNHQSMALLQTISNIAPEEAKNPEYLKICIENYVDLGRFDQALTFIETLNLTAQRSAMDRFDDSQYVQKVYIKAGKAALFNKATASKDALSRANSYFLSAFADTYSSNPDETSSSEDTGSIDEAYGDDSWDIMLLHEESAESKSDALADIFTKVFGLNVTCMYQDCIPGTDLQESLFCIMKKSKLLVVLAGGHRVSRKYHRIIRRAVKRPTTVALLIDGDHIPGEIKKMTNVWRQTHHMVCPAELLTESDRNDASAVLPHSQVQALCDIFSFLVNIPLT